MSSEVERAPLAPARGVPGSHGDTADAVLVRAQRVLTEAHELLAAAGSAPPVLSGPDLARRQQQIVQAAVDEAAEVIAAAQADAERVVAAARGLTDASSPVEPAPDDAIIDLRAQAPDDLEDHLATARMPTRPLEEERARLVGVDAELRASIAAVTEVAPHHDARAVSCGALAAHPRPITPSDLLARGRILVVDGDDARATPLERALHADGHEVLRARSAAAALGLATQLRPEVVLLRGALAKEVCGVSRGDHGLLDARIMILGESLDPRAALLGLEGGGDDYLAPDVALSELAVRVRAVVRRDRSLREASPLTGLPGNARITSMVERCIDEEVPFALVHGDLRNFKAYNDRYGFARGDQALIALAQVVSEVGASVGRPPCVFGHLGGDDFAMVCPPQVATAVCEEAVERFELLVPRLYDPDDWERGFIEVANRQGERSRFTPLTVGFGVATSVRRRFAVAAEAAAVATEMKQLAKLAGRSAWRIDQRSA